MHDNLDENDILRDGQRLRVRMMMRDHLTPLQRAVLDHNTTVVVDSFGDTSLNHPGYRFIQGMDRSAAEEALNDYIRDTANAWRGPTPPPATPPSPPPMGTVPDDAPPRFMDAAQAEQIRQKAYQDYVARLCNAGDRHDHRAKNRIRFVK
jgi:hypothetical protein